jgi:hypothetical protein
MANSHVLITSQTLGSAVTSVTFGSGGTLTQSYRDLQIVIAGAYSIADASALIQFNGDTTAANYSAVGAYGNGTTASSYTSNQEVGWYPYPSTGNGIAKIDIFDYTQSKHKTLLSRANAAAGTTRMVAVRWANTAAITSITLVMPSYLSPQFNAGTTFYLYGVLA